MGCSGGGGGGGGGGDNPDIPDGFAPKELKAGMVFELVGSMEYHPGGSIYYVGDVEKRITVTSPTSGTVESSAYVYYSGPTGLTYELRNSTVARMTADNYPYNTSSTLTDVGNVELRLSFTSENAGTFVELGKDGLAYGGAGDFTLTVP